MHVTRFANPANGEKKKKGDQQTGVLVGWLADRGNKCYNLTLLTPSACKAPIAHPEVRPILDQACVKERRLEKDKERI